MRFLLVLILVLLGSPASAQWTKLNGSTTLNVNCATGSDDPAVAIGLRLNGAPFKTLPFATKWMYENLNLNGNDLTFQIADGECDKGVVMNFPAVGQATRSDIDGKITFRGNTSDASKVVIRCGPPYVAALLSAMHAWFYAEHLTIRGCYNGMETNWWGSIFFRQIRFENIQNAQIQVSLGGYVEAWGDYTIVNGAAGHVMAGTNGMVFLKPGVTISLLNTPNFSLAFAYLSALGTVMNNATPAGNATGNQCLVTLNSVVVGASTMPGDVNTCFVATGGQKQ